MPPLRILVADDSAVIRKLLSGVLSEEPDLEVVGTAADGEILLQRIPQTQPDVVILDVEMPTLNGLDTLRRLRPLYPTLPVIMFSNLTQRGAEATMDALLLGAQDYVPKPESSRTFEDSILYVRETLIPKIKALAGRRTEKGTCEPAALKTPVPRPTEASLVRVVVIGVSTGGPNALGLVLSGLSPDLPVPVMLVQHMPRVFTEPLIRRLAAKCPLVVREAHEGDAPVAGSVWVAPGDFHLGVVNGPEGIRVHLNQGPPVHSCRPSADVLFQDAARVYGSGVLGVVLTGMGCDGLYGCESIREAGGRVLVQDEATSVVWGMPRAVVEAGLADSVLPIGEMAVEINRRCRRLPARAVRP